MTFLVPQEALGNLQLWHIKLLLIMEMCNYAGQTLVCFVLKMKTFTFIHYLHPIPTHHSHVVAMQR